jgi:hypothetical protein
MRLRSGLLAGLILFAAIAVPGRSCGPFTVDFTFVDTQHPEDLTGFVQGRPFIVQPEWRIRSLALSYRLLNGPALTPGEKNGVLAEFAREDSNDQFPTSPDDTQADYTAWQKAYAAVTRTSSSAPAPFEPNGDSQTAPNLDANVPGSAFQTFPNCLGDAFRNAARTLSRRQKEHPDAAPALADWAHAQDAVFSNCSGAGGGVLPATLPTNAPPWLQQDRAYQLAAAHFYRKEYPAALTAFRALAADQQSPWHDLAAYLVARTLIRQATLDPTVSQTLSDGGPGDPVLLAQAETVLKPLAASRSAYAGAARELLNLVQFRLHPATAIARVGNLIARPDPYLPQHLADLRQTLDTLLNLPPAAQAEARSSDLVDWIETLHRNEQTHAIARWKSTHREIWLAAALLLTGSRSTPSTPELLAAAAAVPTSSAAWPTIASAALRDGPDTFAQAVQLREQLIGVHALTSSINQLTELALQVAPTAADFARLAPMPPAGSRYEDTDFEELPKAGISSYEPREPIKNPTMAGLPVNVKGVLRVDAWTATILNRRLPLRVLVPLLVDDASAWPRELRFEAAMAVWTRAVLLDRPEAAAQLTPILLSGEPGWAPYLNAYGAAPTPDERRITGLLAMLRFPSVRPFLNAGPSREEGFVGYSEFRDNWWCGSMDLPLYPPDPPDLRVQTALPPFIQPEMASAASAEEARILQVGDAPAFFGRETLAWVKAHPADPRNAELLGFTFRAMRNGCNLEASTAARRQVYKLLRTRYPNSTWAKHWPTFDATSDPTD